MPVKEYIELADTMKGLVQHITEGIYEASKQVKPSEDIEVFV